MTSGGVLMAVPLFIIHLDGIFDEIFTIQLWGYPHVWKHMETLMDPGNPTKSTGFQPLRTGWELAAPSIDYQHLTSGALGACFVAVGTQK